VCDCSFPDTYGSFQGRVYHKRPVTGAIHQGRARTDHEIPESPGVGGQDNQSLAAVVLHNAQFCVQSGRDERADPPVFGVAWARRRAGVACARARRVGVGREWLICSHNCITSTRDYRHIQCATAESTMRTESRTTAVFLAGRTGCTVRKAVKDRLFITGAIVAALLFAICSVTWAHTALEASLDLSPWAHMTLEASLNVLWLLLAIGFLAHWVGSDGSRCRAHLPGLISLVFILSLLFPVISANDDLAQLDLINNAKTSLSITTSLNKNGKQLHSAGLLDWSAALADPSVCFLPVTPEFVPKSVRPASVATPGDTTGNHSPPLLLT
jgi:hypothetical protein